MFWNDGTNTMAPLVLFGALAAVEWGFFFISYFVIRRVNFELESLALFLTGIGVMMLIRQSERSAYVQLVAAAIGMIFFCIIIITPMPVKNRASDSSSKFTLRITK